MNKADDEEMSMEELSEEEVQQIAGELRRFSCVYTANKNVSLNTRSMAMRLLINGYSFRQRSL